MLNKAAWLKEPRANPLTIEEAPFPRPGRDQILIKNAAVAINPVDWKIQDYGVIIKQYPAILGEDLAGEVVEVGEDVSHFKPGDRVIAHSIHLTNSKSEQGVFQLYTVAFSGLACKIPESILFTDGVVLPLAISTASSGLYTKDFLNLPYPRTDTKPTGQSILVYGGSSSVGAVAIQLAAASGLSVVTTASSQHHEWIKSLGASSILDHKDADIVETLVKAMKSAGNPVGAYDAISSPATRKVCADVLDRVGGGFIASTLGIGEDEQLPASVKAAYCFAPAIYLDEPEIAKAVWSEYVPQALREGSFKCKPESLVVGSGVESIQAAMNKHKEGVSGQKVVVTL